MDKWKTKSAIEAIYLKEKETDDQFNKLSHKVKNGLMDFHVRNAKKYLRSNSLGKFPSKMPKITRQQSAARKMNLLKMDMLSMLYETPDRFDLPYNPIAPIGTAIHDTIAKIQQYMQQSHRIATLINLYYLGELLKTTGNPKQKWQLYLQENPIQNSLRYYRAAMRIFEIFRDNMDQIYRTKFLSMNYIFGMTNEIYRNDFIPYVRRLSAEDFAY
jgi:hypothetical protein